MSWFVIRNFLQTSTIYGTIYFQFRTSCLNPQPPKIGAFQPEPEHFENVEALINRLKSMRGFSNHAVLSFINGIVQLVTKPSSYKKEVAFGGLEHQLGFKDRVLQIKNGETHMLKSTFPPNMTRETHRFYIHSSLVNGATVNEKILPLLATVDATKGNMTTGDSFNQISIVCGLRK